MRLQLEGLRLCHGVSFFTKLPKALSNHTSELHSAP
jgi:hypothetical protein